MARPFLKWVGGKTTLVPELRRRLPSRWRRYHEHFVGAGGLFFALQPRPAVLADANARLITTYVTVRDNIDGLVVQLRHLEEMYRRDPEPFYYTVRKHFNEISGPMLASAMIFLNKACFNGVYRVNSAGGFNVPWGKDQTATILDEVNLRACSAALQGVEIVCEDFRNMSAHVGPEDFVYFDPPYVPLSDTADFTAYTAGKFALQDQRDLVEIARRLKARGAHVVLSNSSAPAVRLLYADGFAVEEVQMARSVNTKANGRAKIAELLIR